MGKMRMLICLDLDRTLIDSIKIHVRSFNEAFVLCGLGKVKDDKLRKTLDGRASEKVIKRFFPRLSERGVEKVKRVHKELIIKKYGKLARPLTKNTLKVLKMLKEKYVLAIISNATRKEVELFLNAARIPSSWFEVIVSNEEVRKAKPDPEGIKKAWSKVKCEKVVMIGDSVVDVLAGKAAGAVTIAVEGTFSRRVLRKTKPDYILKNIDILPDLLKNQKVFKDE